MTTSDERIEGARSLATEYRKDVRFHVAYARKALERGDVEEARWHLDRAKVWRVNGPTTGHVRRLRLWDLT
jgi:hypothetical protein